jgi:hypothetical protein
VPAVVAEKVHLVWPDDVGPQMCLQARPFDHPEYFLPVAPAS